MAETGPCGPCSEIHMDRGEAFDNLRGKPHSAGSTGNAPAISNCGITVFIQYNRIERIPSSRCPPNMWIPAWALSASSPCSRALTRTTKSICSSIAGCCCALDRAIHPKKCLRNFTPYRVICDHARAAAFLIADGVVPGNVGRNYVCRMIIRRAARFGTKLGLHEPFLPNVAEAIIAAYGDFYPELVKSREVILDNLRREEIRFARTVESGTAYLQGCWRKSARQKTLDGRAFRSLCHLWPAVRDRPRHCPGTGSGCG